MQNKIYFYYCGNEIDLYHIYVKLSYVAQQIILYIYIPNFSFVAHFKPKTFIIIESNLKSKKLN